MWALVLAREKWKECVVLRAGGCNGVMLAVVLVGVLVELHHCDTCGKVLSYPCAEFCSYGGFPYNWHRAHQTWKRLGLFLLCFGLCHLRGEQAKKALAELLFNGTSGCVRSSRRNCWNEKTVYWKKKKKKIILWTGNLNWCCEGLCQVVSGLLLSVLLCKQPQNL